MNYFTADVHLFDYNTIVCDNRPFKSVKSYNRFVVKDWNKTAKKGDTIYVIGDLFSCGVDILDLWRKGLKLVAKIKADVVLIIGNNEQRIVDLVFGGDYDAFVDACKQAGIKDVYKSLNLKLRGKNFHLVHQIIHGDKSKINLFGHTHLCSGLYNPYGLCLSTDLNHFRLYSEDIVFGYLQRKKDYWEPDDNTNYVNPFLVEKNGKIVNIKQRANKAWQTYMHKYNYTTKIVDDN